MVPAKFSNGWWYRFINGKWINTHDGESPLKEDL